MESVFTFIESYVSISYILAVVFGTDAMNKFIPFLKRIDNRWVAILVPAFIAVIFYFLQVPESRGVFAEKIFVSFLCAIAMYDFLIQPLKKYIEKKLKKLEDLDVNTQ